MNDIEDRLRESLHDLADTVPPSANPRADLDGRLAGGPRHRALLMAAAAVVVVAAVVVPIAVSGGEPGSAPVATNPPGPPEPTGDATLPGYLAGPVELGRFGDHAAVLWVEPKDGGERMCVAERVPAGQPIPDATCEPVPRSWPAKPMGWVLGRSVLGDAPDSGPLPHLMLFVVAPQVHELEVQAALGDPVPLDLVAETPGARFFLADFGGSTQGFGYIAWDASGNVLVQAIT